MGSSTKTRSNRGLGSARGGDEKWGDSETSNYASPFNTDMSNGKKIFCDDSHGMGRVGNEQHVVRLEKRVIDLSISDHHMDQMSHKRAASQNTKADQSVMRSPLGVITNQLKASPF